VDAVGSDGQRYVDAVVHQEQHMTVTAEVREPNPDPLDCAVGERFRPELDAG
jgi:hypothetical protein